MKLLIEISDTLYNFVNRKTIAGNSRNFDGYDMYDVSRCIGNGKPIDRMTNRDVIKAIFPDIEIEQIEDIIDV